MDAPEIELYEKLLAKAGLSQQFKYNGPGLGPDNEWLMDGITPVHKLTVLRYIVDAVENLEVD